MRNQGVELRSFIIKIVYEGLEKGKREMRWHGSITAVENGERVYFKSLDVAFLFLAAQLDRMGVHSGWYWRLRSLIQKKKLPIEDSKGNPT